MKEKYAIWKEWMTNPRYKAFAKLGFWIIFFVTLFLIAYISALFRQPLIPPAREPAVVRSPIDNFINMDNFEFTYIFTTQLLYGEEEKVTIVGTFFNEKYYFTIGEREYYDNSTLYLVDRMDRQLIEVEELSLPFSRELIRLEVIHSWMIAATFEEETVYRDGRTVSSYFYRNEEGRHILITIEIYRGYITSVTLDLTNFLSTYYLYYEKFVAVLNFENINNIASFERNFNEWAIIELGDGEYVND